MIRRACSGIRGRQQGNRLPRPVHARQLEGLDRPGREPLDVRGDADSPWLVRLVLDRDGQQGVGLGVEQMVDAGGDRLEPDCGDDAQAGRLGPERHPYRLSRRGLPLVRLGPLGVAPQLQLAERLVCVCQGTHQRPIRVGVGVGVESSHKPADQAGLVLNVVVRTVSLELIHVWLVTPQYPGFPCAVSFSDRDPVREARPRPSLLSSGWEGEPLHSPDFFLARPPEEERLALSGRMRQIIF